jgi:hypothetical protein
MRDRTKWGIRWSALALFVLLLVLVWMFRGYH